MSLEEITRSARFAKTTLPLLYSMQKIVCRPKPENKTTYCRRNSFDWDAMLFVSAADFLVQTLYQCPDVAFW
jgi:hypothetical protein